VGANQRAARCISNDSLEWPQNEWILYSRLSLAEETYASQKCKLHELERSLQSKVNSDGGKKSVEVQAALARRTALPKIKLPEFSGNYRIGRRFAPTWLLRVYYPQWRIVADDREVQFFAPPFKEKQRWFETCLQQEWIIKKHGRSWLTSMKILDCWWAPFWVNFSRCRKWRVRVISRESSTGWSTLMIPWRTLDSVRERKLVRASDHRVLGITYTRPVGRTY